VVVVLNWLNQMYQSVPDGGFWISMEYWEDLSSTQSPSFQATVVLLQEAIATVRSRMYGFTITGINIICYLTQGNSVRNLCILSANIEKRKTVLSKKQ